MCSQTRNSCAKAFDNQSRSKNLKPKKSSGGEVNLTPPPPPKASRVIADWTKVLLNLLMPLSSIVKAVTVYLILRLKEQFVKFPLEIVPCAFC